MTDDSASPPGSDPARRRYNANDIIAGKYKLIKVLGEGGMGEVWEAKNIGLDSSVAIKLIRSDLDEDSAGERLVQEARAAARLGHPAIVRVFDVGETHLSDPFIVMELLKGDNLGDLLGAEGRLPAVAAVQILLPIADALATAHLKGIVHRDIKPDNIYLAEDVNGELQPKLVDFGVAKFEYAEVDSKLTLKGTIVGSPGYLAPEQARGSETADYRVDVWAFSVVLYELITGLPPFNGGNYNALLRSIVEDNPTPTTEHAAGDSALWQILERGLRKPADERWPSMLEYGRALAHWAFAQGVDEDVCGTGLEAKWLNGKVSGRSSLVSVNFEDSESPSAIRKRRRLRTDALAGGGPATQAPPPPGPLPSLPSPREELSTDVGDERDSQNARAFANTELDSMVPGVPRAQPSRRVWWFLGLGFVAAAAVLLLWRAATPSPDHQNVEPGKGAAARERAGEPVALRQATPAVKAETRPSSPPIDAAEAQAAAAPSDVDLDTPSASPLARASRTQTKAPAPASVQSNTSKKRGQKALTQTPENPKLDLKKPY